jgi:hypothetical protein
MPQGHKIDAILVCHPFTDHCDEATLRTGSPNTPIFVHHAIVDRVKGLKFFNHISAISVHSSKSYPTRLCSSQSSETSPAVAISALYFPPDRFEMAGDKLHGCTLITVTVSLPNTTSLNAGQLFYVLYAPHGTYVSVLRGWLDEHPHAQCLALIHGFDEIDNPWYLGEFAPRVSHGAEAHLYLFSSWKVEPRSTNGASTRRSTSPEVLAPDT